MLAHDAVSGRQLVAGDGALHALFIHGVGEQSPAFATLAAARFGDALDDRSIRLYHTSAHWAPLADRLESDFMSRVVAKGSAGRPLQHLVAMTLADALVYQSNGALREQIQALLDREIARLRGRHVVVFAHSLGCLIFTDYLRARPNLKNVSLVTMGLNLELFFLGERVPRVPQLENTGWVNLYDRDDLLGWPATDPNLKKVLNYEVSVGSWWQRWIVRGAAHIGYWDDRKLWSKTMPFVLGL